MEILIRKHSSSLRFKPHYNSAMGCFVSTKHEYLQKMKEQNLEPYRGDIAPPKSKEYKPSQWARDVVNEARAQKGKRVSDRLNQEIVSRLTMKRAPVDLRAALDQAAEKGGFY